MPLRVVMTMVVVVMTVLLGVLEEQLTDLSHSHAASRLVVSQINNNQSD